MVNPFLNNLFIEHTNQTNPNHVDVLAVKSKLDVLELLIKTEKAFSDKTTTVNRDFWTTTGSEILSTTRFTLDVEEVRMLIKKLQEFVDKYEEYSQGKFVVGKSEDLIQQQEDREQVDVPMPTIISTNNKPVKIVHEGPEIDELTATNKFFERMIELIESDGPRFDGLTLYPWNKLEEEED